MVWSETVPSPSLSFWITHIHTHCELRWSLRSVISASQVSCCCRCLVAEESEESLVSLLNSHESQGVTRSSWGHGPSAYRKDTFYGRILKSPVETSVRLVGDEVYEFQDCDDADFTRHASKALKTCKQVFTHSFIIYSIHPHDGPNLYDFLQWKMKREFIKMNRLVLCNILGMGWMGFRW